MRKGSKCRGLASPADLPFERREYLAMVGGLSVPLMAGCTGGTDATSENTLHVSIPSPLNSVDPHMVGQIWAFPITGQMVEPLFEMRHDFSIEGRLVDDLEISEDGLTWHLTIHEGVQFHEPYERELVAEDIAFNFDRAREAGQYASNTINHVDNWEVEGDYTLRLEFEKPAASVEAWLASFGGVRILSPEAVEEQTDGIENITEPVGTGPFKFEEWVERSHLTASKNEAYWQDDGPHVDEIVFRYIPDESAELTELESGTPGIDISLRPPIDSLSVIKNHSDLNVKHLPSLQFRVIETNCSDEAADGRSSETPTAHREIRQAVNEALNRVELVEIVESGNGYPSQNYFPEDSPWHHDYAPYSTESNPSQAEQLIEEAGFSTPVEITVIAPATNPVLSAAAPIVQENLNQSGFDVTLEEPEFGEWVQRWFTGQYDLSISNNPAVVTPDQLRLNLDPDYNDLANYTGAPNTYHEEVFQLFEEGNASFDESEQKEIYDELQELLIDDSVTIPLYHPEMIRAYRNSVQGYEPHPDMNFHARQVQLDQ